MKIDITVKPNSKRGPMIQPSLTGELLIYVRESAIEGKANKSIVELVADYYDVPKTRVEIIRGHTSKRKTVQIDK